MRVHACKRSSTFLCSFAETLLSRKHLHQHQPMGSSRSTTADGGHKSSGRYSREVHHSLSTWTYSPSLLTFTISILTCCIPTLSVSPNLCSRPPPPLDCGGIYNGEGFYYNASSPTPCLRWPDWSCLENSMFSTIDECMSTCVPGEMAHHQGVQSYSTYLWAHIAVHRIAAH